MNVLDTDARKSTLQNCRNDNNVPFLFVVSLVTVVDTVQMSFICWSLAIFVMKSSTVQSHSQGYVILHFGCQTLKMFLSAVEPGFSACEMIVFYHVIFKAIFSEES